MLLVAPTESACQRVLRTHHATQKWTISSLPEKHGCDFLFITSRGVLGFQRKTLPDLNASLLDGRLNYELAQLSTTATVSYSYLIIESTLARTVDGRFVETDLTINALRSILAKFQSRGVGFLPSDSPTDTVSAILSVAKYIGSGRHELDTRPKNLKNQWNTIDSNAYALFLLQSFPGIGPKQALAILNHFSPNFPLQWNVTVDELIAVPGIGRKTAERLISALSPEQAGT